LKDIILGFFSQAVIDKLNELLNSLWLDLFEECNIAMLEAIADETNCIDNFVILLVLLQEDLGKEREESGGNMSTDLVTHVLHQ